MKKYLKKNRVLIRLIGFSLISGLVLLLGLSYTVSGKLSEIMVHKTVQQAGYAMDQANTTLYTVLTGIYGDYYDFWMRDDDMILFRENKMTNQDLPTLREEMQNKVIRNGYVSSLTLIDRDKGIVLTNTEEAMPVHDYYDKEELEFLRHYIRDLRQDKNEFFLARKGRTKDQREKEYLTMVYADGEDGKEPKKVLLVNIDAEKLTREIQPEDAGSTLLLIDREYQVVSVHPASQYPWHLPAFLEQVKGIELENVPYKKQDLFGAYSLTVERVENRLGLTLLYLKDMVSIRKELRSANQSIAFFFLVGILLNIVISLFFIRRTYAPLRGILKKVEKDEEFSEYGDEDEYGVIESALSDLSLRAKKNRLMNVLRGIRPPEEALAEKLRKSGGALVVSVRTEGEEEFSESFLQSLPLEEEGILRMAPDTLAFLFPSKKEWTKEDTEKLTARATRPIGIGIGPYAESAEDLKNAYRKAELLSLTALEEGDGQALSYDEWKAHKPSQGLDKKEIVKEVLQYIEENYGRSDLLQEEISSKVGVSLSYLRQIFKEETGSTINDIIVKRRIEEAKKRLRETGDTGKQIAEEIGFSEPRYFYTSFKKWTGLTTDEYRRSHRKEEE